MKGGVQVVPKTPANLESQDVNKPAGEDAPMQIAAEDLDLPEQDEMAQGNAMDSVPNEPLSAEAGIELEDTSFLYPEPSGDIMDVGMDTCDASADDAMAGMVALMDCLHALGVGPVQANMFCVCESFAHSHH